MSDYLKEAEGNLFDQSGENKEEKLVNEASFLDDIPEEHTNDATIKELSSYVVLLEEKRAKIAELEEEISKIKKEENDLSENTIPNFLLLNGLSSLKMADGKEITVEEDLRISLPKEDFSKRSEALKFIESVPGGNNIIKNEIIVDFPKEKTENDIARENALKDYLKTQHVDFEEKKDIHAQTLKSFFKELIGLKKNVPAKMELEAIPEVIRPYIFKKTKIKG